MKNFIKKIVVGQQYLSSFEPVVARYRIANFDAHKLVLFQFVPGKELLLLYWSENNVFWNQFMLSNVDQKFIFIEGFQDVPGGHVNQ